MKEEPVLCRCGKPANLDVAISAAAPYNSERRYSGRNELHFSTVACRNCAFAAAKVMLEFLEKVA